VRAFLVALTVLIAAGLAFALSWVAVFFIGINETSHWECDGPCFDKWDEVMYVAFVVAGACAIGAGYATWRLFERRSARHS
jgi:hypothetical protein